MRSSPVRLGLTGGIGSGKTTVAHQLWKFGATVVDADAISRRVTAARGASIPLIAAQFGCEFIDSSGALNREKMREAVFHDPAAKSQLEQILHPLIRQVIFSEVSAAEAIGASCIVLDIPLLVESGSWRQLLDKILVVDCTRETQIQRVKERSELSENAVRLIINAQASRYQRLQAADLVVFNDSISFAQLTNRVQACAAKIGL